MRTNIGKQLSATEKGKPQSQGKQAIYINTTKKGGLLRQFFKCCIYNNSLITLTIIFSYIAIFLKNAKEYFHNYSHSLCTIVIPLIVNIIVGVGLIVALMLYSMQTQCNGIAFLFM